MGQRETQPRIGPHAQTDDMGSGDAQGIENAKQVLCRDVLAILVLILGYVRRRIATHAIGHAAVAVLEMVHLLAPGTLVAAEFVHKHQRRGTRRAVFFHPKPGAVDVQ